MGFCGTLRGMALAGAALGLAIAAAPSASAQATSAEIAVDATTPGPVIDPNIYGQFVEHLGRGVYEGIWVGPDSQIPNTRGIRNDVVAALKQVKVPVIRWPGGCFADAYHWQDGIGPRGQRPAGINAAWNRTPETNAFGTHEFMDFMEQIGAKPFVSINVGSGTVREGDDWMRYMTAPAGSGPARAREANGRKEPWNVPFIGVGNETWGCGGNMTAETYAASFRHYAAFLRNYSGPRGNLIAVGSDTDDYDWTDKMMALAMKWRPNPTPLAYTVERPLMWGLSLHFYTFAGNWGSKGRNVGFDLDGYAAALKRTHFTDELIARHAAIMDKYDPEKKVALAVDEWGAWFDSEKDAPSQLYLESTLRDAVIAGMTLNIFNAHADRVRMANLAQMVNVIQSLILTDGAKMVVTPTWHVFDMYKVHQGATLIPTQLRAPDYVQGATKLPGLNVSASRDAAGKLHLTIVNLDPAKASNVRIRLAGASYTRVAGRTLTADRIDTRIRFDAPDPFVPKPLSPSLAGGVVAVTLPSKSVSLIEVQ